MSSYPDDLAADEQPRRRAVASAIPLSMGSGYSRRLQKIRLHFSQPFAFEIWIWALVLFLLTNPFTFTLMGQDPTVGLRRDAATMRRDEGSQALIYVLRFGLVAFAIAMSSLRWKVTARAVPRLLPLGLFVAWCLLSVLWSDSADSTLHGVAALLCLVLTAFLLSVRLPMHLAARALIYSGLIMGLCSLFEIFAVPAYGMHQSSDVSQSVHAGAWRGVYLHKNHFGQLCAIYAAAIFVAGPAVIRWQSFKWSLFALMLFLIARSTSASAIVVLPAGLFMLWVVVALRPLQKVFALTAAAAGGIIGILSLNIVLEMLGRDPTFSGRTRIWETAYDYVINRPFGGYGYVSATYGGFAYELSRMMGVSDPHNGYLDIVMGLGLVGLGLYLSAILSAWSVARSIYLIGGVYRQGILVLAAPLTAWLVTSLSEANSQPLGTVTSLGFASLAMVLAAPRAKLLAQKLPIHMRSWELPGRDGPRTNEPAAPGALAAEKTPDG